MMKQLNWEKHKVGAILKLEYGKPLPDEKRISDGNFPVYGANGLKGKSNEYYCDKKSIVVGRKGSAGEINLTEDKFWPLDVTYFITFDEKKYNLFFLYYLLNTLDMPNLAKGIKPGLNRNEVYNLEVYVPSLPEQTAIADFLDNKCEKIDTIIALEETIISELNEYKKSIIQKAVTKGISNAPLKDSGIEWLGKIPKNWEVKKIKYFVVLKSGDGLTNDVLSDDETLYPVFGGGKQIGYYEKSNVNSNNILIGRVGANCGCVTKVIEKAWATDNALIVYSDENLNYLYYILLSADFNNMGEANAQPLITASKVLNIKIPFCEDIQEQKAIAAYLDTAI